MLSVCIPIYNFNVEKLVCEIHSQASQLKITFEIILIDDCSESEYKMFNRDLASLIYVKYIELPENIGRSKIRNLFLQHASFNYLLFLDCDAHINSSQFIKNYIDSISSENNVICGGLTFNYKQPAKQYRLRWKYGLKKEVKPFSYRMENPYKSFNTINFLIKRDILAQLPFDERIVGYGHEDTMFGYLLKTHKIPILHLDNPVVNDSLEKNIDFLNKTEQAIDNLIRIDKMVNDSDFEKEINLLQTYNRLKKTRITFLVSVLFWIFKPVIRKLLISGFANLNLFAFYKLGFLIERINKN